MSLPRSRSRSPWRRVGPPRGEAGTAPEEAALRPQLGFRSGGALGAREGRKKEKMGTHMPRRTEEDVEVKQDELYELAVAQGFQAGNNIIGRHSQGTCHGLDELERTVPEDLRARLEFPSRRHFVRCYQCSKDTRRPHPVYLFCCRKCGDLNRAGRALTADLTGKIAVVTGGRTKIGHQVVLKLLRAGCAKVVATTRAPEATWEMFRQYRGERWSVEENLIVEPLDLDVPNLGETLDTFVEEVLVKRHGIARLDILINSAAQSIRARDKPEDTQPVVVGYLPPEESIEPEEKNRYGDARYAPAQMNNSWQMRIEDLDQKEAEECFRINALAPALLIQKLLPLLQNERQATTAGAAFVVNVHAREGLLDLWKDDMHVQTNMAKCALHMVTRCLAQSHLERRPAAGTPRSSGSTPSTPSGTTCEHAPPARKRKVCFHGVDPGWVSVDEYFEANPPWVVPPLDERDGAARVLYPVFKQLGSRGKTRRHFHQLAL